MVKPSNLISIFGLICQGILHVTVRKSRFHTLFLLGSGTWCEQICPKRVLSTSTWNLTFSPLTFCRISAGFSEDSCSSSMKSFNPLVPMGLFLSSDCGWVVHLNQHRYLFRGVLKILYIYKRFTIISMGLNLYFSSTFSDSTSLFTVYVLFWDLLNSCGI